MSCLYWEEIFPMYVKLCLRNIRRNAREYWAYAITVSLTAALVYALTS